MKLVPRTLAARLAVALLFAGVVLVVLDRTLRRWDGAAASVRASTRQAVESAPDAGPDRGADGRGMRRELQFSRVAGVIALVRRGDSLPPDVAPAIEVLADGSLVLRRPAVLPGGPGAVPAASRDGIGGGIIVPGDLSGLSAAARGSLLLVVGRLAGERPVAAARLRALDFVAPEPEVRRLLSWLP